MKWKHRTKEYGDGSWVGNDQYGGDICVGSKHNGDCSIGSKHILAKSEVKESTISILDTDDNSKSPTLILIKLLLDLLILMIRTKNG